MARVSFDSNQRHGPRDATFSYPLFLLRGAIVDREPIGQLTDTEKRQKTKQFASSSQDARTRLLLYKYLSNYVMTPMIHPLDKNLVHL